MSRDREGAPCLRLRHEHRHSLALIIHHVSNRSNNLFPIAQPKRAPVARSPFSIATVRTDLIQSPASVRFEGIHHLLRLCLCFHDCVNVVRARIRCQKRPTPVHADFPYRVKHYVTAGRVQYVRLLIHQIPHARRARRIPLKSAISKNIMVPIHGTSFIPVQMCTIARERDQVRHARLFYTAPSPSRLISARSLLSHSQIGVVVQQYRHNLFG